MPIVDDLGPSPTGGVRPEIRPDSRADVRVDVRPDSRGGVRSDVSRRRFLTGGAAIAGLAGLAACSSNSATDGGSSSSAGGGTRTVTTAFGSVSVPVAPRRVACLDPGFSWQTLLEVGITPVALPMVIDAITVPANLARIKGIPTVVDASGAPDIEKLAAARPDLILANSATLTKSVRAQLAPVAPVAAYAFDFPSDWASLDHSYAAAVNRSAQLSAVTAKFDQRAAQIRDQYGDVIKARKWALVTKSADQVFVWGQRSSAGPVLTAAGAPFSAGAPGKSTPFTPLSLEKLDTLDDATVLMYGANPDGSPFADTESLLGEAAFKALPAARAGHLYPLPSWFAYCYQDALVQLDGIEKICRSLGSR